MSHQSTQHVAQLNIGQLLYPFDDPRTSEFTDNLEKVNAIAERSEGFVWRCVDEEATLKAEGVQIYDGDPCALATLSVWESPRALEAFVHKSVHGSFLKRRGDWFKPQDHKTYVVWPVAVGHRPGFREGLDRLAKLQADGPTEAAYDFEYLKEQVQAETFQ